MKRALVSALILAMTVRAIPAHAQLPSTPLQDAARREATRLAATISTSSAARQPDAGRGDNRSWIARHPAAAGALIGFGVGFAIGAATCAGHFVTSEGTCSDFTYPGNLRLVSGLVIGGMGAGIGAGVGAAIGSGR